MVSYVFQVLSSRLRARVRDEDGAATVDAVMWIPLLFAILVMVVDVSFLFTNRAELMRLVQDTNRALSTGLLASEEEAETILVERLAAAGGATSVDTTIDNNIITTTVSMPASQLDVLGWFPVLRNIQVTVASQHYLEF